MEKITRSVIKLSEIPEYLQKNKIFNSHKIHTYAIFHIDDTEEEVKRLAFKFYLEMSKQMNVPDNLITENYTNVDEWFDKLNQIKEYYEQMDKEVHFNRGNLNK